MDLYKQRSTCVNLRGSYVNQPLFYINHANSENSHYDAIQDSGWTRNDYQHLQW